MSAIYNYQGVNNGLDALASFPNTEFCDTRIGTTDTPTRQGADGKQYPFDPNEPSYVSKFPVGWSGCYKCGKDDHSRRENCPEGNNQDQRIMEIFHKELKCHKPAFRRPIYAPKVSCHIILSVLLPQ